MKLQNVFLMFDPKSFFIFQSRMMQKSKQEPGAIVANLHFTNHDRVQFAGGCIGMQQHYARTLPSCIRRELNRSGELFVLFVIQELQRTLKEHNATAIMS